MALSMRVGGNVANLYETIEEMRRDTLRNLLYVTIVGSLIWYLWSRLKTPASSAPDSGLFIVPVLLLEGIVHEMLPKHRRLAAGTYLGGAIVLISAGLLIFQAPEAMFLYSVLALAAVVVSGPKTGLAFACLGSVVAYVVLLNTTTEAAPTVQVLNLSLFSILSVLVSWTFSRDLTLAVRWSLASYEYARENLEAVQERRAEVIRLNQELGRSQDQLEHDNAALVRAWRAAEEAERRQQQITAFISHELRTPLNLVIGFSEMLVNSPETYALHDLPPKARRDLQAVYRSAQQVGALVDDVLDMASVAHGHLPLMREPSELWQVIIEAASLIRDYVEAKHLQLRLTHKGRPPVLLIDRLRIRQVLLNLLVNAARFTNKGSITVRLIAEQAHVRVEVTDTGRGISADQMDNVFRQFRPVEAPDTLRDKGTGLGLPLSRQIIRLHGGEMGAESEAGRGSTFWFTLPREESAVEPGKPLITPRVVPIVRRPGTEPTVVVFDQEELATNRLRRWLDGYHLLGAQTWEDALVQAEEHLAVAVLADLDAAVPEAGARPPVLRCNLPTGRRWAKRLGVAAYLEKPIREARLWATLESVVSDAVSVLVVDDDERFVRLITRMLERSGHTYRVFPAYNGVEALSRLRQQKPDVMLLDLVLPQLDGWQLLREMAVDSDIAGIPVIVISASPAEISTMPEGDRVVVSQSGGLGLNQEIRLVKAALKALAPEAPIPPKIAEEPRAGSPG